MIEPLARKAEAAKLEQLLGAGLPDLQAVDSATLAELRELVTARMYEAHLGAFERAVHASGILPVGLSATIAEKAFGPLLCARLSGLVDTSRAIAVAARLPTPFLADVATFMDPRRAADVIGGIPAERVQEIAELLAARGEHVVMGRFAGHLTEEALARTFEVISDEALLRIAFTLEDASSLDRAVALLPPERMEGVLAHAAEAGLWTEALTLVAHLGPQRRQAIAAILAGMDGAVLDSLAETVDREGLAEALAPLADGHPRLAAHFAGRG